MALREDYQDYVPNAAGKKYIISDAGDGLSTITDATTYDSTGDTFNAGVINATNAVVNKLTPLQFQDVSVDVSAFVSDATYSDYAYRAEVALSSVTEDMIPEVVFGMSDAISGVFAPIAACYEGGVYLYASEQPSAAITVPLIECRKAV